MDHSLDCVGCAHQLRALVEIIAKDSNSWEGEQTRELLIKLGRLHSV